jgi:hypothetical protein
MSATQFANSWPAAFGLVRAECQCCGRRSKPVEPNDQGEPDLWKMARGWSEAPFPADCAHSDGSKGSVYTCPACNRKLRSGQCLPLRAGRVVLSTRRVA